MPNNLFKLTFIATAIVILGACSASSFVNGLRWITYSQPLNEADLNEMLSSGTKISMDWANGESGAITYNSDGSATADVEGKSVQGNWRIQDSRLCMNWNSSDRSARQCYSVYSARGKTLKMFDERGSFYAKVNRAGVSS